MNESSPSRMRTVFSQDVSVGGFSGASLILMLDDLRSDRQMIVQVMPPGTVRLDRWDVKRTMRITVELNDLPSTPPESPNVR